MPTLFTTEPTPATKTLESQLACHPLLRGLKPEHVAILKQNAMLRRFEPGEIIFREGDPANRFYLIQSGLVQLESNALEQETIPVQRIGDGEVLGWSWLFPPHYWRFDARALEPTDAIFFYGTRLREECESNPELGYELMKRMTAVVISRLQAVRRELKDLRS